MPRKPVPPPDDPEESQRFIDTAREVEADESPEAFDRAFDKVTKKVVPPKRPLG
jgi:hypothetical protein